MVCVIPLLVVAVPSISRERGHAICRGDDNGGGGRSTRLVRPFEKKLNQTFIGPTRTLKNMRL